MDLESTAMSGKIVVHLVDDQSTQEPGMAKTESPLRRQWTLLRLLCSRRHGLTVAELSQELETSAKTIRRDLDTFRTVGFAIEEVVGEFGRKSYKLPIRQDPPLAFTYDEALAIYLGRRYLDSLTGTVFWEASQRAFRKIRSALSDEAIAYIEKLAGSIHVTSFGWGNYADKAEIIDQIVIAIEDHHPLIMSYQPERSTEPVEYEIYPYSLVQHQGSLYLIAWSRDSAAIRHFKIDRLIEIHQRSDLRFSLPDGFDVSKHLEKSFGIYHGTELLTVRVRFSKKVARYVTEKRWQASQKVRKLRNGSVELSFELATTAEVRQWIMSFGADAEVLEPEVLRREIAQHVERLRLIYATRKRVTDQSSVRRRRSSVSRGDK
jgi:predicted DNA-binding transcriptional regulator YafY